MTTFTYTTNIPDPPNSPSVDVPNMQVNTNSVSGLIAVDHIGFGVPNGGAHNQCQISSQSSVNGAIPSGLLGAGFETLYSSVKAGLGELYFVRGADLTGIQLTGPSTPSVSLLFGKTFLPGGILMQWGTTTASGSGTRNYLFNSNATNINFPNACFQVIAQTNITTISSGIVWSVSSISTTGFSLGTLPSATPSGTIFTWFAIGN